MLNVGIVGLGFMGMIHYLAYQRLRGVKVAAVCEQDAVRRAGDWRTIKGNFGPPGEQMDLSGVAQYAELDAMLADPAIDLVDICLPTALHAGAAIKALPAGKHVFCEKPIALQPADADRDGRRGREGRPDAHDRPRAAVLSRISFRLRGDHQRQVWPDAGRPFQADHFRTVVGAEILRPERHRRADAGFARPRRAFHSSGLRHARERAVRRARCAAKWSSASMPSSASTIRLVITATSGVIAQQGRPFTHGYEIYLERATLLYDFAVIDGKPVLATARNRARATARSSGPNLRAGNAITPFENGLTEVVRAVQSGVALAAFVRRPRPRRRGHLPEGDRVGNDRASSRVLKGCGCLGDDPKAAARLYRAIFARGWSGAYRHVFGSSFSSHLDHRVFGLFLNVFRLRTRSGFASGTRSGMGSGCFRNYPFGCFMHRRAGRGGHG